MSIKENIVEGSRTAVAFVTIVVYALMIIIILAVIIDFISKFTDNPFEIKRFITENLSILVDLFVGVFILGFILGFIGANPTDDSRG